MSIIATAESILTLDLHNKIHKQKQRILTKKINNSLVNVSRQPTQASVLVHHCTTTKCECEAKLSSFQSRKILCLRHPSVTTQACGTLHTDFQFWHLAGRVRFHVLDDQKDDSGDDDDGKDLHPQWQTAAIRLGF
jgi:hypothetical protein